jgi:hypothetical protein
MFFFNKNDINLKLLVCFYITEATDLTTFNKLQIEQDSYEVVIR